jgi:bla regulator protein blaR1
MPAAANSIFFEALGGSLLNSVWQMALLWIAFNFVAGFLDSVLRLKSTAVKTNLAFTFLFAGFVWFAATLFTLLNHPGTAGSITIFSSFDNLLNNNSQSFLSTYVFPYLSFIYLFFLFIPLYKYIKNYRYVKFIKTNGLGKPAVDWKLFVQKNALYAGIKRPVQVFVSSLINSPFTIGFLKPVILLPAAVVCHLSIEQTEAILLHELAHIKRNDYFINLIIQFIKAILFYNPFVKMFVKTIEREREKSCDELVLQFRYEPLSYATALLRLEQLRISGPAFAIPFSGNSADLLHRIEKITGKKNKPAFPGKKLAGIAVALLVLFLLQCLSLKKERQHYAQNVTLTDNTENYFAAQTNPLPALADISNADVVKDIIESVNTKENKVLLNNKKTLTANGDDNTNYENETGFDDLKPVTLNEIIIPETDEYQEKQIQAAVDGTKKIAEEAGWKSLESQLADAASSTEKKILKEAYTAKLEKQVNTEQVKNRFRLAYDKINWDKINKELANVNFTLKADSLLNAYTANIDLLDNLREELADNKLLNEQVKEEINTNRKKLLAEFSKIKKLRNKKIIHL